MQEGLTPSKYKARSVYNAQGIRFDSQAECDYDACLRQLVAKGEVVSYTRQPSFVLQEGFRDANDVAILPIAYRADFDVYYADGHREIVDVKGIMTDVFRLKRKLFLYRYPFLVLRCVKRIGRRSGHLPSDWRDVAFDGKKKKARKKQKASS